MVGRMLEIEVDPPYMQRREAVTGPQQYGGCGRTGTRIQASWLLVQCSPPIPVTLPLILIGCQPVPPIAHRPRAKGCIGKVMPLSGDLELGIVATSIAERGGVERSKSSSPTPPTYHQVLPPPYTHTLLKFQRWLIYFIVLYMAFSMLSLLSVFIPLPMNHFKSLQL